MALTPTWYGSPQTFDWQAWFERFRQLEQQVQQTATQMDAMQREIAELKNRTPVHVEYHFDQLKISRLEGTLNIGLTPQGVQGMEQFDVSGAGNWSPSSASAAEFAPGAISGDATGDGTGATPGAMPGAASAVPGPTAGLAPNAAPGTAPGAAPGYSPGPAVGFPGADAMNLRIRELQAEAAGDVERSIPSALYKLADQFQVPINEPHLRAIIDDIKKQLNHRVHYYARTTPYPEQGTDEERANWSRSVLGRTKRDVETAIAQYVRSLVQPRSEGGREKT